MERESPRLCKLLRLSVSCHLLSDCYPVAVILIEVVVDHGLDGFNLEVCIFWRCIFYRLQDPCCELVVRQSTIIKKPVVVTLE
jgi:hypothetical protein